AAATSPDFSAMRPFTRSAAALSPCAWRQVQAARSAMKMRVFMDLSGCRRKRAFPLMREMHRFWRRINHQSPCLRAFPENGLSLCMQRDDARWMGRAIEEARRGIGRTAPNPPVGSVIVKDGVELGAGWHRGAGLPHAEREAMADARGRHGAEALRGATAYVTL